MKQPGHAFSFYVTFVVKIRHQSQKHGGYLPKLECHAVSLPHNRVNNLLCACLQSIPQFYGMERIEKLKGFLAANPADSFVQHALALEYIKQGDDAEARRLFELLLNRDPAYIGSYYHLGKLLERQGDRAAAIQCFERGMAQASAAGDNHALNELRGAWDNLND